MNWQEADILSSKSHVGAHAADDTSVPLGELEPEFERGERDALLRINAYLRLFVCEYADAKQS
jgi:hypothetical protein